ncbi:hypothetical protein K493DRAFT_318896 [Basidiobolus meristosporus CBS 931.73]|uniref:Cyclin N-terminal domain-containing protein n=1 Tax=Basidiobolus meristosporus CBS 931.73 TaxID=1314790 RepID=A0A1Y1XTX8_9FUNG|nr:hypothetical protein K493DRAFT_318896 [Basidiobolus meristosporus CBS 931.73]|eukprot:ORX89198.1 hypothetical protein K493DRAFT_318896 [Basidiobolus meristosporus CBS 931.73]
MFDNNVVVATQHVIDHYFSSKPKDLVQREIVLGSKPLPHTILTRSSPNLECLIKSHIISITSNTVNHLFECALPNPSMPNNLPQLDAFITRVFRRSNLPLNNLLTALLYLVRLKEYHPSCKGTLGSGHRLFLAALMMANKYLHDGAYHNKTWRKIADGFYELQDLNQMESEFLSLLKFELAVKPAEWVEFMDIMDGKLTRSWARKGIQGPRGYLFKKMTAHMDLS